MPKTAMIVEAEKAVTAKNLGRVHGNRGKTAFSTKLTAKNEKFRKGSSSWRHHDMQNSALTIKINSRNLG